VRGNATTSARNGGQPKLLRCSAADAAAAGVVGDDGVVTISAYSSTAFDAPDAKARRLKLSLKEDQPSRTTTKNERLSS
jgi:hypothetical protein